MKKIFLLSIVLFVSVTSIFGQGLPNCPQGNSGTVFFPNPNDCRGYFECSDGVLYWHNCPAGLYWNNSLQVCDWLWNVDCIDGGTLPEVVIECSSSAAECVGLMIPMGTGRCYRVLPCNDFSICCEWTGNTNHRCCTIH